MIPLEDGLLDAARRAPARTWPGAPRKARAPERSDAPRLQQVLTTSYEAGYSAGERDGFRTAYWQGWAAGMFVGAFTAGIAIAAWLGYTQ